MCPPESNPVISKMNAGASTGSSRYLASFGNSFTNLNYFLYFSGRRPRDLIKSDRGTILKSIPSIPGKYFFGR